MIKTRGEGISPLPPPLRFQPVPQIYFNISATSLLVMVSGTTRNNLKGPKFYTFPGEHLQILPGAMCSMIDYETLKYIVVYM